MKKSVKKSRTAAANDCTGPMSHDILKALLVYHEFSQNASMGEVKFWRIRNSVRFGP